MTKKLTTLTLLLGAPLFISCGKEKLENQGIPTAPIAPTAATYPGGPLTATYGGEAWQMNGGEARIVEGMDPGTKLLEVTLWTDGRPTCQPGKHVVTAKEIHLLVPNQNGETHIFGINPDGSMITFQYAKRAQAGVEFAAEGYVFIESMDNSQVKGKAVGKPDATYQLIGGEFTVPLCP